MLIYPSSFPILNRFLTKQFKDFQTMTDFQNYFSQNIDFLHLLLIKMNPLLLKKITEKENEINEIIQTDNYEKLRLKFIDNTLNPNYSDEKKISLIEKSAFFNSKKCLKFLLEENASIDRRMIEANEEFYQIGLMEYGALKGNKDVVNTCLERGQKLQRETLLLGLISKNNELVEWMIEEGQRRNHFDEKMKTDILGTTDNIEFNENLLKKGIDINAKDKNEWSALMRACLNGNVEVVFELLERKADPNACDDSGGSTMMFACVSGYVEIVRELIKRGADVNTKSENGSTALMGTIYCGHIDLTRELLERGADVNAKDHGGKTALHVAIGFNKIEVVKELIKKGADINAKDNNGETPLMEASQNGHIEIVKELINRGADINAKDSFRKTALDLARSNNHHSIVDLLTKQLHG